MSERFCYLELANSLVRYALLLGLRFCNLYYKARIFF